MDTKELAAQLAAMEAMSDQDQEHAFNHLQGVLQPDGLELNVDEDMQFAVRVKQAGEPQ